MKCNNKKIKNHSWWNKSQELNSDAGTSTLVRTFGCTNQLLYLKVVSNFLPRHLYIWLSSGYVIYLQIQCFHGREAVGDQGGRTGMYFQPSRVGECHCAGLRDVYFRFWSSHYKKKGLQSLCESHSAEFSLLCPCSVPKHTLDIQTPTSNTPFLSLSSYLDFTVCYHRFFFI